MELSKEDQINVLELALSKMQNREPHYGICYYILTSLFELGFVKSTFGLYGTIKQYIPSFNMENCSNIVPTTGTLLWWDDADTMTRIIVLKRLIVDLKNC